MIRNYEIADLLVNKGAITKEQLEIANQEVKRTGFKMEQALERLNFITENEIANILAQNLGVPFIDLTDYLIDTTLVELIPEKVAKKYKAVPLFKIGSSLTVAMVDPKDMIALDELYKVSKMDAIEPVLATEKGIQKILDSYYSSAGTIDQIIKSVEEGFGTTEKESSEELPIIKIVNIMIMDAVKENASDIHIEPEEEILRIRYRIDGILHEVNSLSSKLHGAVVSRIKVLSNLDIAETRKPQDGRLRTRLEDKELDIRVSTFPTIHGENIVMRILDKSSVMIGLNKLGLGDNVLTEFEKLIKRPNGIVLVTGPTG
ncbi:MAG: ATPase, T2SS/T4P/T4SS family, partial [Candidatus Omnitrophota bacterium]